MDKRVFISRCDTYDACRIEEIVERSLDRLGLSDGFIKKGMRVLVKPNLLMARMPGEVTTTHPAVMEAVCKIVVKRGAHALIADSPAGSYTKQALEKVYRLSGMYEVAENSGATLNFDLSKGTRELKNVPGMKWVDTISPVLESDLIISVCKLKTHALQTYTGAVKNMFGSVPGVQKGGFHARFLGEATFARMTVGVCEAAAPALSIMDAVVGMEGDGPSGGTPVDIGAILVSKSPNTLDLAATHLVGIRPQWVKSIEVGMEMGLCPKDWKEIELLEETWDSFDLKPYKLPGTRRRDSCDEAQTDSKGSQKPMIVKGKCIGCGDCANICPAKIIDIIGGKAVIGPNGCIKCYCCHEVCPERAINI